MSKIHIVDAPCGAGKSLSAINMINESSNEQRFIYVTPFLTEVERIKKECSEKNFKEPEKYGTKKDGLKYLLKHGRNIVTTHSLFRLFDEEIMYYVLLNDYILIMDEVPDVIELLPVTQYDSNILVEEFIEEDEDGNIIWKVEDYTGKFEEYKNMCDIGSIHLHKQLSGNRKNILIWMLPTMLFDDFKEVYVLTYMYDAQLQKYYYDYNHIPYDYLYIKDFHFTNEVQEYDVSIYKNLINICENDKMNLIGERRGSLSFNWYSRNSKGLVGELKRNCSNFFRNMLKSPVKLNMWTTFKEYKKEVSNSGYASGWLPINSRATNEYSDRENIAYLVNKYMNPSIKHFFIQHGVEVNEDKYALSELIQFIFRSRIRNLQPINLYIPSKRMRNILKKWLDGVDI